MDKNKKIKEMKEFIYKAKENKNKKSQFFKCLKLVNWDRAIKKKRFDPTKSGTHATIFHSPDYKKEQVLKRLRRGLHGDSHEILNAQIAR